MTIPPAAITTLAALPFIAIVVLLGRRWMRRRRQLDDDRDYTLVFPEHPDETPARGTKVGRALKPRR